MFFRFVTKHICDRRTDRQTGRQNYDPTTRYSKGESSRKGTLFETSCTLVYGLHRVNYTHQTAFATRRWTVDTSSFTSFIVFGIQQTTFISLLADLCIFIIFKFCFLRQEGLTVCLYLLQACDFVRKPNQKPCVCLFIVYLFRLSKYRYNEAYTIWNNELEQQGWLTSTNTVHHTRMLTHIHAHTYTDTSTYIHTQCNTIWSMLKTF